jgi:DegV family protein with EDD domain
MSRLAESMAAGAERMSAWADLLDAINVFPVADADTGRNLVVSLAPLRRLGPDPEANRRRLLSAARGNSGNIAAAHLAEFLSLDGAADPGDSMADSVDSTGPAGLAELAGAAKRGRDAAWKAVGDPRPGTMLTVFDALWEVSAMISTEPGADGDFGRWIDPLAEAVARTPDLLPELRAAGVVDAGALGAFAFWEGFLSVYLSVTEPLPPLTERFGDGLRLADGFRAEAESGRCVQAVVRPWAERRDEAAAVLQELGESVVVTGEADRLRVHLHAEDGAALRARLEESLGPVEEWSEESLASTAEPVEEAGPVHLMTDAAGSIDRETARRLGITLLDSLIVAGDEALPETRFDPAEVYRQMRAGVRVSTAQASTFERHQHYESVLSRYDRVLYLCVGSAYTGNFAAAEAWKRDHDLENRLTVVDTGAASGRLAAIVRSTARALPGLETAGDAERYARSAVDRADELVFLDQLRFLAAGGRMSRAGAFFGDLLHMKPVITPAADGARKAGVVRNRAGQLRFALERLDAARENGPLEMILLEFSDNREWVETAAAPAVRERFPEVEMDIIPLSLTSGAHMGPGTWGVAYLRAASEDK